MSSNRSVQQLALPLQLDDSATLSNFYIPADLTNQEVIKVLSAPELPQTTYLWGGQGAGVSHLLQACCHRMQANTAASSLPAVYFALDQLSEYSPADIFDGLANMSLICLDHLHAVANSRVWAEQLFHLFNEAQRTGCHLMFGARMSPAYLETPLADLASRLASSLVFHVAELDDEQKAQALIFRAKHRGIAMPVAVAKYLLTRETRSASTLFAILDDIDQATLEAQRKLTVPFVKQLLVENEHDK